ncbi:uncharacterized protein LOC115623921 [Scaptodrosophila lebanonensis]|uniref:Uncharacterized protein LOC115623921 n=1 Tax=Drosophila lebanonensis TaxID=7225 RepID=A0A6J2TGY1_DROLE|nr:uncharacterized protein LOC115623921 [Scaptodrosophila lebanonensis]
MGTRAHTGRTYLNSCITVPIDPCNNCPAPIYNRPKTYMGKQTSTTTATNKQPCHNKGKARTKADTETGQTWTNNTGIRSLAKFYDSIPDYSDVKHLHQAEFYSTLQRLRSTSRELRSQANPLERCTSAVGTNALANYCGIAVKSKSKKRAGSAKSKKKKAPLFLAPNITPISQPMEPVPVPTPPPVAHQVCHKLPPNHCEPIIIPAATPNLCLNDEYSRCLRDLSRLNSFKHDFAVEVADFKRTLKDFEQEFKRTENTSKRERHKATTTSTSSTQTSKAPAQHTAERAKCRRERLRRSLSVNDLQGIACEEIPTKPQSLAHQSIYFPTRAASSDVPKIHIESPSVSSKRSSSAASSRVRGRARRAKSKPKTEDAHIKAPLSIFQLESPRRAASHANSSASPMHPVARPNLAATLRAEVSRKKVKELKNNCTYHDPTPQFDWEVRKTPAWKSLSLNESHKALLSIRLASRKAEQALQEREYELHMEMMRQRVKSAPLLLEGPTYWGPEVGKLTHTCRSEGLQHACLSNQQRSKQRSSKKKCGASTNRSSRCPTVANDGANSNKFQQLRKIYGSGSTVKSCSRQSHRSSKASCRHEPDMHDSADELCSVDRAFL